MTIPIILLVAGVLLLVIGSLSGGVTFYIALLLAVLAIVIGLVGLKRYINRKRLQPPPVAPSAAIAHTPEGKPVYPIVGYTSDGRPVTAERAVGYQRLNPKTNTLAIVTLIVSLVFSVLAIPLGHIALGQIKKTGEQGRALAIAGLVIGYVWLTGLIVLGLLFFGLAWTPIG